MIDLHTHSTASDGSITPQALAQLGKASGLAIQALTDHDNIHGVASFMAAAREVGLIGVPGVELSAEVPQGQLHIVGLNINPEDSQLIEKLDYAMAGRDRRNWEILAAFNAQGIDFTMEEVKAFAGDELVSRVHFAQALLKRGLVQSVPEAFERFIGKGACCYRERFRYTPAECIALIREAGGVAVMAHPFSLERDSARLLARVQELKALGIEAMECLYAAYGTEDRVELLRMAKQMGLVASVASDFHGSPKPDIALGTLHPDESTVQALRTLLKI